MHHQAGAPQVGQVDSLHPPAGAVGDAGAVPSRQGEISLDLSGERGFKLRRNRRSLDGTASGGGGGDASKFGEAIQPRADGGRQLLHANAARCQRHGRRSRPPGFQARPLWGGGGAGAQGIEERPGQPRCEAGICRLGARHERTNAPTISPIQPPRGSPGSRTRRETTRETRQSALR